MSLVPGTGVRAEDVLDWIDADPDGSSREEVRDLLAASNLGDAESSADLEALFAAPLRLESGEFSGPLGPGPGGVNPASVLRIVAGLASFLGPRCAGARSKVLVAFDERPGSEALALLAARAIQGSGGLAILMPRPLPRPLVAFSTRLLLADAALGIAGPSAPGGAASVLVLLGGRAASGRAEGARILGEDAALLEAAVRAAPPAVDVPLADEGWGLVGQTMIDAYVDRLLLGAQARKKALPIAVFAAEASGLDLLLEALSRIGLPSPVAVGVASSDSASQVLDAAIVASAASGAGLVLALGPNGSTCSAAIPAERPGAFRALSNGEVEALLVERLARSRTGDPGALVSWAAGRGRDDSLLRAICERFRIAVVSTDPGIGAAVRVDGVCLAVAADGICADPAMTRDADGIGALTGLAELAARWFAKGSSLEAMLDAQERLLGK